MIFGDTVMFHDWDEAIDGVTLDLKDPETFAYLGIVLQRCDDGTVQPTLHLIMRPESTSKDVSTLNRALSEAYPSVTMALTSAARQLLAGEAASN